MQRFGALGIPDVTVLRGVEDNVAFRRGMNNSATARGLTQTMKLIAEGKVVSQSASEKMIAILLGQEFNESIPALLPASVRIAHKTGWTDNVYHDTGISTEKEMYRSRAASQSPRKTKPMPAWGRSRN
jgi:beta-lactamase class A